MKKILILGNSAKEYALAKLLSEKHEVYVAPGNDAMNDFATCLDIRDNSVAEILEYVLENNIDITIPVSNDSINTDIVELFTQNNQQIFAPGGSSANFIFDKSFAKKLMYKLRIPTPKFGIFEKQNMVNDYIKNLKNPYVIKTNSPKSAVIFTTQKSSKNIIESLFVERNQKVIIEDYVYGTPFAFYAITDGYKALPIGSSVMYKHSLEGDGGQLTSGMGSCVPNPKLSESDEEFLMSSVIYPTLDYLETSGSQYIGIFGVNGIISDEGKLVILGYQPFLQDTDCAGILSMLDTDLYSLFSSCVVGSFSDEYDYIPVKNMSAVSVVLKCANKNTLNNVITYKEAIDEDISVTYFNNVYKNKYLEFEARSGSVMLLTGYGRTLNMAASKVYNELDNIEFAGLCYRKDISGYSYNCKDLLTI